MSPPSPARDELLDVCWSSRASPSRPRRDQALSEHARFARELQVPEAIVHAKRPNWLALSPRQAEIIDEIPASSLSGRPDIDARGRRLPRGRRSLGFAGFIGVTSSSIARGELPPIQCCTWKVPLRPYRAREGSRRARAHGKRRLDGDLAEQVASPRAGGERCLGRSRSCGSRRRSVITEAITGPSVLHSIIIWWTMLFTFCLSA